MADAVYGALPFKEQIDFFRGKVNLGTESWTDIFNEEHDKAFVVAGAMRDDLLGDFRAAVDKAISQGTTLEEFRKDFDQIVAKYGWEYNGGRNWRSKVIYDTNLRTSYAAGRWKQIQEGKAGSSYLRYRHMPNERFPRLQHMAWDGLILPVDHPFWVTHFPPCGWGCQCWVDALSERFIKSRGLTVTPDKGVDDHIQARWKALQDAGTVGRNEPPPIGSRSVTVGKNGGSPRTVEVPAGVDPGFGYTPGRTWVDAMTPSEGPGSISNSMLGVPKPTPSVLPPARPFAPGKIMDDGLSEKAYTDAFLENFDIDTAAGERQTLFEDVTGEFLSISDALFTKASGGSKLLKGDRAKYVNLLAQTLISPDEIWVTMTDDDTIRRRYVAQWTVGDDEVPGLAVFEWSGGQWNGVTAFSPEDAAYIDRRARIGELIYRRKPEE